MGEGGARTLLKHTMRVPHVPEAISGQRRHDCDRLEPRVTSAAIAMGGVTDKSGVRLRPPRAPEAFRSVVPMHL